jgi:hypothetical protein
MSEKEMGAKERVIRGVEEVSRGVREVGGGVRDATVAGVETAKEAVKSRLPHDRQTRDNVVMVRVDKDTLDRMDDLVETGMAGSRSEAANFLIVEGVKARQTLFDAVSAKVAEIREAKEELRKLRDQ